MSQSLLICLATLLAQAPDPWVGKRVILHDGAVLRIGNQVVDDEKVSLNLAHGRNSRSMTVFKVEQTNGPWLWLVAEQGGGGGWVTSEWVVPFDHAIDYFTNLIRANPSNATNYQRRALIWLEKERV